MLLFVALSDSNVSESSPFRDDAYKILKYCMRIHNLKTSRRNLSEECASHDNNELICPHTLGMQIHPLKYDKVKLGDHGGTFQDGSGDISCTPFVDVWLKNSISFQ